MVKVLFVCLGNICRSPTAEGVFTRLVEESGLGGHISIDSAGTHAYHVGSPPDRRAMQAARRRGVELGSLTGRRVEAEDFENFDYILAMDEENFHNLTAMCPDDALKNRIQLFLDFAPHMGEREVPDPYYGGESGFERVLDLVEAASHGLLEEIRRHASK